MMLVVCLLCSIAAHLLSFGLADSWTGVVESGSGFPAGELLLLLFTLWLLVICRRSRARKEATLDSISDWECLRQGKLMSHKSDAHLSHSPLPLKHLLKFEALYGHLSFPLWDRQT